MIYDNTSPSYRLSQYRNPEKIQAESVLDDFMFFLEYDSENGPGPEETKKMQAWISEYLGYNIQQVQEAEKLALEKWRNSNQKLSEN